MNKHLLAQFTQAFYVLIFWLGLTLCAQAQPGSTWISRTSAADNYWISVTYGNGLFVAVAFVGTSGNRVMTSPDGINWTLRATPADNYWEYVTYLNGQFIAVSADGGNKQVMTSPNGINWTLQTTPVQNQWSSVAYGNGTYVAVSFDGTNRVMTSPDGITWTSRNAAANNQWYFVTFGKGLFVAVAASGSGNRVMTSPDGITWTSRTSAADNSWSGVTYGNGLFVAVAFSGTGNRVMTSPDGINWTARASAADNAWQYVTYGNGVYVAVASSGTGNRVMTSSNGINWTSRTSAADNDWISVTYGNGLFVAVGASGTGNRVMTSSAAPLPVNLLSFTAQPQPDQTVQLKWTTSWETNNKGFLIERSKDLIAFETVGLVSELAPNSEARKDYSLTDQTPYPGTSYYRLSQTDLNGQVTRFPAVSVVIKDDGYGVFPNPVVNGTSFSLRLDEPQTATLSLTNAQGRALPLQKTGVQEGNLLLNTSGALPAGVYLLSVQERGQTRQHRLVVH